MVSLDELPQGRKGGDRPDRIADGAGGGVPVLAEAVEAVRVSGLIPADNPDPVLLKGDVSRRSGGKSVVVRVNCVGEIRSAVAKYQSVDGARLEARVYCEILPALKIDRPRLYGLMEGSGGVGAWIVLEDGCEDSRRERIEEKPGAMSAWLAGLHVAARARGRPEGLPERGVVDAKHRVERVSERLKAFLRRRATPRHGHDAARVLLRHFLAATASWEVMSTRLEGVASTMVHGDFASKNVRLRPPPGSGLIVFDWEMGGWGTPAHDLGASGKVDLAEYAAEAARRGHPTALSDLEALRQAGRVLRLAASVDWCLPAQNGGWATRSMAQLDRYAAWAPAILADLGLRA